MGLNFVHECGPVGSYFFPEIMGSGCALFDYDNDGRLDIYLIQNAGPDGPKNRLFHQEGDGTFKDVSEGSGLDVRGYGMGVAIGDVNNDGLPDVLVTEYGRIRLFLNRGQGHFEDVTKESGLNERLWAMSAAFFDYDRDGYLDLAVASYVAYDPARHCADASRKPDYCGPRDFEGTVTKLYHNRGVSGGVPRFDDVTATAGLARIPARGLGLICADFDGDGWPDLFVANDAMANHLWINQRNGTFQEEGTPRGLAYNAMGQALGNMGVALADVNGDGWFDLFVTHLTEEQNTLWTQGPLGHFTDLTSATGLGGVATRGTGFGTVLADFDNDGWPDLALVNGRVLRKDRPGESDNQLSPYWAAYAENNRLFRNESAGRFKDISRANGAFCGAAGVSRGLAFGDIFNDGGVGLLATSVGGPARLFRNTARRGHWLSIRAVDPRLGGRDAYGARITVTAAGRSRVGWVNPASSYLCSNDPRVHFGLGSADHVDAIRVQWPDGLSQDFPAMPADQLITLTRVRIKRNCGGGLIAGLVGRHYNPAPCDREVPR